MRKKFRAFSLVEMLITLVILSIVMLIATQTLNTIVKVSAISKYKTVTRNEIDFSLELIDRLLSNSNIFDVYVFNSIGERAFNSETDGIVLKEGIGIEDLDVLYSSELASGLTGNEIHVRPYGYSIWVCIGYFEDSDPLVEKGYLLKRTMTSFEDGHKSCFDTEYSVSDPLLVLTSKDVAVNHFLVSYTKSSSNNNVFYVDLEMEPVYWVVGSGSSIEKTVFRQAVITTQGLTWY